MELPDPPFVLDAQTIIDSFIYAGSNANQCISLIEKLFETGQIFSMSTTRNDVNKIEDSVWGKHDLQRIKIQNKNIKIRNIVTELVEECEVNDINITAQNLSAKIDIIALARAENATIITTDVGPMPFSMKSLCELFGVEHHCFHTLSSQL